MGRQTGQILPLGIALLLMGILGALVLFNTGQSAADKARLANTADAAAYSGLLWQARALNFQAYSNRAMVANQVSIAQAVSLRSWARYGRIATENISDVLAGIPFVGAFTQGMRVALTSVEAVMEPVSEVLLRVVDSVNRGLSKSQEALFLSSFKATPEMVGRVVTETDPRFTSDTAFSLLGQTGNAADWDSFSRKVPVNDRAMMTSRADMINRSLDGFSKQRNWEFFDFWLYSTPFTRHKIFREGETRLIMEEGSNGPRWEWKAKDTVSLHNRIWRVVKTKKLELPIGWAEAFANSKGANQSIERDACRSRLQMSLGGCSRFLQMNRKGEYFADTNRPSPISGTPSRQSMSGYHGLQAFRALSKASLDAKSPSLKLRVEVAMPIERSRASDDHVAGLRLKTGMVAPGDQLSSISIAELFYKRPNANLLDAEPVERANSYNPYWDVRLSPIEKSERLLAFSLRGSGGDTTLPEGGAAVLAQYQGAAGSKPSQSLAGSDVVETDLLTPLELAVADVVQGGLEGIGASAGSGDPAEAMSALASGAENATREIDNEFQQSGFGDALAVATANAQALKDEALRVRAAVVSKFEAESIAVREKLAAEQSALRAQADAAMDKANANLTDRDAADLQVTTAKFLREKAKRLGDELTDRLAQALVDIMASESDMFVLPLREARRIIRLMLEADDDTLLLPWDDVSDE